MGLSEDLAHEFCLGSWGHSRRLLRYYWQSLEDLMVLVENSANRVELLGDE